MPRGNGTGPMGMGSQTGKRLGYCSGYRTPGYAKTVGRFTGSGFGRGLRRRFNDNDQYPIGYSYPQNLPSDEKGFLNRKLDSLEDEIKQLKKRLAAQQKND